MKKTVKTLSIICLLMLNLLALNSCSKKIKSYDSLEGVAFLEKINEFSKALDHNYVLLDLRKLDEEYALGHFYGFTSYDLGTGNLDELESYMKGMHHLEKHIFIIDSDGSFVVDASTRLKKAGYKKIYVYLGGFEKLNEYNAHEKYFKVVTGKEDCAC